MSFMSTARFVVAFVGPGVVDGTIDVRDLAPALLSLGEAVDAANRAINGPNVPARVKARATSQGSYEVQLDLILQGWEAIKGVLLSEDSTAALNLLTCLGFFGSAGLVPLLRWLKGRRPDKLEQNGSLITITAGSEQFTVSLEVLRLYRDAAVSKSLSDLLDTLETGRVEQIEFRSQPGAQPEQVLSQDDRAAFDVARPDDETVVDETGKMALSIRTLAFQEGNKWRLFDGQNIITATIDDKDFLGRVDRSEIRFANSDLLICDVQSIQRQGIEGLKTEHIVRKVLEYRRAPSQLELDGF